jgi:hypothetical protein
MLIASVHLLRYSFHRRLWVKYSIYFSCLRGLLNSKAPNTDMASAGHSQLPLPASFTRGLAHFQKRLSAELIEEFQFASFQSLQEAIQNIQKEQAQKQSLRNLNKIRPFLNGLAQSSKIIELFINMQPLLAAIWVSFTELDILIIQNLTTKAGTNQILSSSMAISKPRGYSMLIA